jgi:hypothetical protein
MKTFFSAIFALAIVLRAAESDPTTPVPEKPDKNGWITLFDGKTLEGWKSPNPECWEVKEGAIFGHGPVAHLFTQNTYTNLEFKAEVKLNHSGNSGMYFRTAYGPGFPRGYETQVENTSPDPQKTGSLYGIKKVTEQLIQDDTWWTQHIIAIGNRIIVKVNDKITVDVRNDRYKAGHLALQQHNQGSEVFYRKLMVRRLPDDEKAALQAAKEDVPELTDEPKADK